MVYTTLRKGRKLEDPVVCGKVDKSCQTQISSFKHSESSQAQSKDSNLAFLLICSVIMFFICHLPRFKTQKSGGQDNSINFPLHYRLVTSIYEAVNIQDTLTCKLQHKDKTPLWYMFVTVIVQMLMVRF